MNEKAAALGLLLVVGGLGAWWLSKKPSVSNTRQVETWRKNLDGTCTYTYDDGSEEVAVCSEPPV